MLPAHFLETQKGIMSRVLGTRRIPMGLNDLNKEEPMHYVSSYAFQHWKPISLDVNVGRHLELRLCCRSRFST
jgi:hypothetical protein